MSDLPHGGRSSGDADGIVAVAGGEPAADFPPILSCGGLTASAVPRVRTTFRTRSRQALSQLAEKPIGTDDTPLCVDFGSAAAAGDCGALVPQLLAAAGLDSDLSPTTSHVSEAIVVAPHVGIDLSDQLMLHREASDDRETGGAFACKPSSLIAACEGHQLGSSDSFAPFCSSWQVLGLVNRLLGEGWAQETTGTGKIPLVWDQPSRCTGAGVVIIDVTPPVSPAMWVDWPLMRSCETNFNYWRQDVALAHPAIGSRLGAAISGMLGAPGGPIRSYSDYSGEIRNIRRNTEIGDTVCKANSPSFCCACAPICGYNC